MTGFWKWIFGGIKRKIKYYITKNTFTCHEAEAVVGVVLFLGSIVTLITTGASGHVRNNWVVIPYLLAIIVGFFLMLHSYYRERIIHESY